MKIRPVGAQLFNAEGRTEKTKLTVAQNMVMVLILTREQEKQAAHIFFIIHFTSIILDVFRTRNCSSLGILYKQGTEFHKKNNYNKLYTVLPCLGVFTFCTCCKILICLVCIVASFKLCCV